jgi:hypothetical protein
VKNSALKNGATDSIQLHQDVVDNTSTDTIQLQQVIDHDSSTDTAQPQQDVDEENDDESDEHRRSPMSVDGTSLDLIYWNSYVPLLTRL